MQNEKYNAFFIDENEKRFFFIAGKGRELLGRSNGLYQIPRTINVKLVTLINKKKKKTVCTQSVKIIKNHKTIYDLSGKSTFPNSQN